MGKAEEMAMSSAIDKFRSVLSSELSGEFSEISYRLTEIEAAIARLTELIENG